ncbi:MAG TPA: hypothetical protein VFX16_07720 [Pseudonocardiaceae bacterium]|nr:hypothetical protein [Pseudonocardiaceae bacterium]
MWSDEEAQSAPKIVRTDLGIRFADETLLDRDSTGVLWTRVSSRPGHGRPEFGQVHSLRQRRAMRRLLCQVCGGPADQNNDGVLWLLRDYRDDWLNWPENMANTYPPVCMPCALLSTRVCPALRRGYVAVRARQCPVSAVYGIRYEPRGPLLVPVEDTVPLSDRAIRWTVAAQLVRSLHGCTIVDLDRSAT